MTRVQRIALSIYFALLVLCLAMMGGAELFGPVVRETMLPVASEGFKIVLAALIGAVSALAGTDRKA